MLARQFRVGQSVRTRRCDSGGHSRLPRYARGGAGVVIDVIGEHPLPDDAVRGIHTVEPVYTVRFEARDLFATGIHGVTVDIWQSQLEDL